MLKNNIDENEVKMVIIIRSDLKEMKKGKMVAQGAHGAVQCIDNITHNRIDFKYINADELFFKTNGEYYQKIMERLSELCLDKNDDMRKSLVQMWQNWYKEWNEKYFYKKIVLKVESLDEFIRISQIAYLNNCPMFMVKDKGLTQIPENTYTACAFLGKTTILDFFTHELGLL